MSIAALQPRAWDGRERRRLADTDYSGRERRAKQGSKPLSRGSSMGDEVSAKEFGHLQAEVSGLRRDMDEMASAMRLMADQLQQMQTTLSEAKGGWRLLVGLGGAAAGLGAGVSWVLQHIRFA